jgi:hypothetical protein
MSNRLDEPLVDGVWAVFLHSGSFGREYDFVRC